MQFYFEDRETLPPLNTRFLCTFIYLFMVCGIKQCQRLLLRSNHVLHGALVITNVA
jgi:hypothetical protein